MHFITCVGEPHCLCLSVCWLACLPTHLFVCTSPCLPASFCTPSVFMCVYLEAALSLTVYFWPSVLSDISVSSVCVLLANQSNKGRYVQSCCCVELQKNKELTAQQCTPDTQDDLENTQMPTPTYAHRYYAYKHTLACSVHAHLPANMCLCECGYGLSFVHIFSWHSSHPNLSLKPVQADAVLKRNPFIIEIGSDVCSFCLLYVSNFLQMTSKSTCFYDDLETAYLFKKEMHQRAQNRSRLQS